MCVPLDESCARDARGPRRTMRMLNSSISVITNEDAAGLQLGSTFDDPANLAFRHVGE